MKPAGSEKKSPSLQDLRYQVQVLQESIRVAQQSGFYYPCAEVMDQRREIIRGIQAKIAQLEKASADIPSVSPTLHKA